MSRTFGGASTTDRLNHNFARTFGTGAWSVGCWINVATYATGRGIVGGGSTLSTLEGIGTGASVAQRFALIWPNATTAMRVEVAAGSTGVWQCLVAVANDNITATNNVFYLGGLTTAMAPAAHVVDTNGSGVATSTALCNIGKTGTATTGIGAAIARAFVVPWAMTAGEAEQFRLGYISALWRGGLPAFYVPMEAGGAALYDIPSRGNCSVVGAPTVTADPPIMARWQGGGARVVRKTASLSTLTPGGGLTPGGTAPRLVGKPVAGVFT